MKLFSPSKLTRTYISALSLIALLTLATFFAMHQVISTQSDSALLVNISGSQRWLSQKAALLSVELVYSSNTSDRKQIREQLSETIAQLQSNHQTLIEDSTHIIPSHCLSPQMQEMYFSPPVNMHTRLNRYLSEALALAQDPEHLLTPNNSHLIYLLQESGNILESLDQIVSLHQKESEAKVHQLRLVEITSGLVILITLAFLGLYIFRPLANTLLMERFQLENANQELSFLSSVDGLTGIANRRHFDQFLNQLWLLATHNREPIALILCDIDFFKAYNDTYGHLQGDECLKEVAASLKGSLKRQGDFIARYGGEEFVVVLPNTTVEGAVIVAETLRVSVENLEIPHRLSSVTPKVTISLGIAVGHANLANSPTPLIEAADKALYQAKQNGRNCFRLAEA
ncbi:diguanylate cyclase domain-containing protein [Desulfosporosinus meridiei]|uniref:Diguanylate cyclase (GGDEF) domain-containing protein n=1 Tax=Desulfosporosinus meridiei (strain ATCC BAA-275 / DSM 13257 / KCTC 12902 / NCIMB 13706 / S10) TaxID=768704 RepID=J7IRB2_DESMD|nr:diguanylate cyclase [Desulfosporosinus meridiei]AFQ42719.1 diguanylate cyclase (GGDEF) domain-containing protein [Desulfosporosinus meridiei DSM 13257]